MKMAFSNKCILIGLSIVVLFCENSYCFNFTTVNGTWIVRQINDSVEAEACPFINIRGTLDKAVIEYQSYNTSFKLKVDASKTNVFPVTRTTKNIATGSLTIYGGVVPFFLVGSVKIKGENATYFVLTRRLHVNETIEKNITSVLMNNPELKIIRFNTTKPQSKDCRQYNKIKDAEYPTDRPQIIEWNVTSTMPTPTASAVPIKTTTTTKPGKNSGSALGISYFVVIVSLFFVCNQ